MKSSYELANEARHAFEYDAAVAFANVIDAHAVADLGCGLAHGTVKFMKGTDVVVVGVDSDQAVLFRARRLYPCSRINLVWSDLEDLRIGRQHFDLVVVSHTIEHLKDPEAFVLRALEHLRPGGFLYLMTPNARMRLLSGERPWDPRHLREYDDESLHSLLSPHFRTVEIAGVTGSVEVRALEINRAYRMKRLARIDPLYLRRFLPHRAIHLLSRPIERWVLASQQDEILPTEYRFRETDNTQTALDLVAICRK